MKIERIASAVGASASRQGGGSLQDTAAAAMPRAQEPSCHLLDGLARIRLPTRMAMAAGSSSAGAGLAFDEADIASEEILGEGAQGIVFRVTARSGAVHVAKMAFTPEGRVALERERAVYEALGPHPNIPAFHGMGSYRGAPCLLLAQAGGIDLGKLASQLEVAAALLAADTAHVRALVLSLTRQLHAALAHVHERGYSHNDVKPENILVSSEGVLALVDFGLATERSALPMGKGSLGFMAPETLLASDQGLPEYTVRHADAYAAANVILKLSTGLMINQDFDGLVDAPAKLSAMFPMLYRNGRKAEEAAKAGVDPVQGMFDPGVEKQVEALAPLGQPLFSDPPFEDLKRDILLPSLFAPPGGRPAAEEVAVAATVRWNALPEAERQGAAALLRGLFSEPVQRAVRRAAARKAENAAGS
jgi:serine/threonine protein kinase